MSVDSAPISFTYLRNRTSNPVLDASPQLQAHETASVTGIKPGTFVKSKSSGRRKKMTERGKAYQLELKFANRNSAYKRLKEQIEIINAIRDSPGTEIEQLEAERDHLDQLKD